MSLTVEDFERIHGCIATINRSRAMGDFLQTTLTETMQLIDAKNAAWTYVNMETNFSTGQFNSPHWQQVAMDHLDSWNRYSSMHPIFQHFMQPEHSMIVRMSDHISDTDFKKTPLYQKWFVHFESNHQVVLEVLRDGPRQFVISLQRGPDDFSDRDVEILEKLQPHLASTFAALERICELESATQTQPIGVMLMADAAGHCEPNEAADARRLAELFVTGNFDSILPTELRTCVVEQDARSKQDTVGWLTTEVQCLGRSCQVLVSPPDRWRRFQVILNPQPQKTESDLRQMGLSSREAELLMALTLTGATNKELSERFSIGIETVKTHLSRAYAKLNVSSRAAAVAKVLST